MRWLRIALFMLGGATIMVLCLLWVARFFSGDGDVTPVIWIDTLQENTSDQDTPKLPESSRESR